MSFFWIFWIKKNFLKIFNQITIIFSLYNITAKKVKENSYIFASKTNWKKIKYNKQLPPQKQEKFFYDYFPTRVYEDIYNIFTKLKDIFSKESDYYFDLTEDEKGDESILSDDENYNDSEDLEYEIE